MSLLGLAASIRRLLRPRIAALRRLRTIRREITTHPTDTTINMTHAIVSAGSARNSSSLSTLRPWLSSMRFRRVFLTCAGITCRLRR